MPVSLVGAAIVMFAFGFSLNLLTILAIVLSVGLVVDDAIVVVENVERHVREGKSRIEAALIGARELVGPDHRDDDHAGRGLHADRLPGRPHRLAVPRVRDHARRGGGGVGHRRGHAVAGDELAVRARARRGRPAHAAGEPRLRRGAPRATPGCSTARSQMRWAIVAASLLVMAAAWPLYTIRRKRAGAGRGPEPHQPVHARRRPTRRWRRPTAPRWRW